jgi:hypothetical protein
VSPLLGSASRGSVEMWEDLWGALRQSQAVDHGRVDETITVDVVCGSKERWQHADV